LSQGAFQVYKQRRTIMASVKKLPSAPKSPPLSMAGPRGVDLSKLDSIGKPLTFIPQIQPWVQFHDRWIAIGIHKERVFK
jgi:hypothetical protein